MQKKNRALKNWMSMDGNGGCKITNTESRISLKPTIAKIIGKAAINNARIRLIT